MVLGAPGGEIMKRIATWFAVVLLLALVPAVGAPAAAGSGAAGYVIGAAAPLTSAQVSALADAGAQVSYVYRNFGGANAAILDSKLAAVRALPFVRSVTLDSVKQLTATGAPGAAALPGRP